MNVETSHQQKHSCVDSLATPSVWQLNIILKSTGFVWINHSWSWPTFQHILLHLNLIELVGPNNDTVASEVDTATGLWCLNLLQIQTKVQPLFSNSLLPKAKQNAAFRWWRYHSFINPSGSPTFLMQNLFRLSLCRRIVILLGIAAQIQVPLSICKEKSTLQSGQLAAELLVRW